MKTTVEIPEPILRQSFALAKSMGLSFKELVRLALSSYLAQSKRSKQKFKLKDCSVEGGWLSPGASGLSWGEIREISERERPGLEVNDDSDRY